jgi:DNA-binding NarL/FixJ family response regulator
VSRVVVLSSHSIFAEGVAARLKTELDEQSLTVVDTLQVDALKHVLALRPSCVILDAGDAGADQPGTLGALLTALPTVVIIRLSPQDDQAQVVTSEQRPLNQVQDLVQVIKVRE